MFSHKESAVRTAAAAVDASNNLGKMYVLWIIFFWADLAAFQILTFSFALRNSWFLEQVFPTRDKTDSSKLLRKKAVFKAGCYSEYFNVITFFIWVSFHEYSQFTGQQEKGDGISLTPLYHPARNYMFKVDNRNTRSRYEICSKLTTKTPKWHL